MMPCLSALKAESVLRKAARAARDAKVVELAGIGLSVSAISQRLTITTSKVWRVLHGRGIDASREGLFAAPYQSNPGQDRTPARFIDDGSQERYK